MRDCTLTRKSNGDKAGMLVFCCLVSVWCMRKQPYLSGANIHKMGEMQLGPERLRECLLGAGEQSRLMFIFLNT